MSTTTTPSAAHTEALRFTTSVKDALLALKAQAEDAAATAPVRDGIAIAYATLSDILDHAWDEVESVRDDLRNRL